MIELFPQLCQEKIQFTAFVDPKLVTFLREQYTLLKTAFKRFRVSVKVCAVQILMHFFPCFTLLCVYRFSNSTLWRRSQRSVWTSGTLFLFVMPFPEICCCKTAEVVVLTMTLSQAKLGLQPDESLIKFLPVLLVCQSTITTNDYNHITNCFFF